MTSAAARRGVRAAAIAILASLFFGGMVGFAAAGEPTTSLPARFGVPSPSVGDRGEYNFTIVQRAGETFTQLLAEQRIGRFEWLPPRDTLDAHGQPHRVNELEHVMRGLHYGGAGVGVTGIAPGDENPKHARIYSYDVATQDLVAMGWRAEPAEAFEHYTVFLSPGDASSDQPLCGLRNPLQGRERGMDERVRLFDACNIEMRGHGVSSMTFKAASTDRIQDQDCVVYARHERLGWVLGDRAEVYVWMCEHVPYPLRIAVEDEHVPDRFSVYRLVAWSRGSRPLESADVQPQQAPAPTLDWKPRRAWGPEEAGLQHPFPLSSAYQTARADPDSSLAKLLQRRPQAYVSDAQYTETHHEENITRRWSFVATDGLESVVQGVTQHVSKPLIVTTLDSGTADERQRAGSEPLATPEQAPDKLPTVDSLARLWQAYRLEKRSINASLGWGFSIRPTASWCAERPGPECGVLMFLTVGRERYVGGPDSSIREDWSRIQVQLDAGSQSVRVGALNEHPAVVRPWEAPTTLSNPQAQSLRLDIGVWRFPTGAFAVGAGVLGVLVGVAYWVWPSLKSMLGMGLFSRLDRPDALHHPNRARLLALVEQNPGIHFQQLRRDLGWSPSLLRHHLSKLVNLDVLREVRTQGYSCYYVPGQVDHRLAQALPSLKSAGARAVLQAVLERGALPLQELSALTRLDATTVHYHVQRLTQAGLVQARRDARSTIVTASPHARALAGLASGPQPPLHAP